MHKWSSAAAFFAVVLLVSVAGARGGGGACGRGDPTGYFEGTAQSKEAGRLQVSLNLRCEGGMYRGEVGTPVGRFEVRGGAYTRGRLTLAFGGGAVGDAGTLDLTLQGTRAAGTFKLAADSGTFAVTRAGDARAPAVTTPDLSIGAARWREDLRFLVDQLTKHHVQPFAFTERPYFENEVAALDERLDGLDGDAAYAGLDHIANLIGDGHTYVEFPPDAAPLPLQIRRYGPEFRVAAVAPGYEPALGMRILRIGTMPVQEAQVAMFPETPVGETDVLRVERATNFLRVGMMLHGMGIVPDRREAAFTLADDAGAERTVTFRALTPAQAENVAYVYAWSKPPLYRAQPAAALPFTYLTPSRTVYANFRSYRDLRTNAAALLDFVRAKAPDKLAIDLRFNGGGDYTAGLTYLIDPIAKMPAINRRGHLFVLVGVNTFSAAMSNAAQFRTRTHALLVGETVGERPNSNQEPREVRLPNSHLLLRYSTRHYDFAPGVPTNMLVPDELVISTWAQFKAGDDPVLDWVLRYRS